MNIFEYAAEKKLRFTSTKGELNTEQLFDLSLGALDIIARAVNTELKGVSEESFIQVKPDPRAGVLQVKLEVLKHIINKKIKDHDDRAAATERATKRRAILDAIAAKDTEALTSASKEDLLKQLADLEK